ncbi:MAG: tetratricopeptide repeat protein [Gammaproteobacteria bacterium]|nr:tetratricopeptide repeat protein [Gammaproteobacteria bacterium]
MRRIFYAIFAAVLGVSVLMGCSGGEERKAAHKQRADELYAAGDFEKARLEYKNVLQIDPDDANGRFLLARTLEKLTQWRGAFGNYERAIELDPNHIDARLGLARILLAAGEFERVQTQLDEVFQRAPDNVDALLVRAGLKLRLGDQVGAREDVAAGLSKEPSRPELIALNAVLLGGSGDLDAAELTLREGLVANPESERLQELLARVYVQRKDLGAAAASLATILKSSPENVRVRAVLAELYLRDEKPDLAKETLQEGVRELPKSLPAKFAFVRFLGTHEGLDAGLAQLEKYTQAEPKNAKLTLSLGHALLSNGRLEQGEAVLAPLISDPSEPPEALGARILLARVKESTDPDEALRLVNETLTKNPSDQNGLYMRAAMAMKNNDPGTAIVDLRTLLRDHPGLTRATLLLARAHVLNDEWEQALDHLKRAIELQPDELDVHELLLRLLASRGRGGEDDPQLAAASAAALTALDARLDDKPDDLRARLFRGRVHVTQKNTAQGIADLSDVVEREPANVEAIRLLARAHGRAGRPAEAETVLARGIAKVPENGALHADLAQLAFERKDIEGALTRIDAGLAAAPQAIALLRQRANMLQRAGRWDELEATGRRIVQAQPTRPDGYYFAGIALQGKERFEESAVQFELAMERSPNAIEPLTALARSYHRQGRSAEALTKLDAVLAINPQNFAALNLKGELLLSQKRFKEAEAAFTQVMELRPQWAQPYRNLSLSKAGSGDKVAAVAALEQAMSVQPNDIRSAYQLAELHRLDGNRELAISHYRSIVERAPGQRAAANNLAMLLVAMTPPSKADLDAAYELVKDFGPESPLAFQDTLGWIRLLKGETEAAKEVFMRIVKRAPKVPVFRYHLARAHLLSGDTAAAKAELERALATREPFEGRADAESAFARIKG